ncbi:MAG: hypothetical protein AB1656_23750 [Candidatus Omnitrophota bacterium]
MIEASIRVLFAAFLVVFYSAAAFSLGSTALRRLGFSDQDQQELSWAGRIGTAFILGEGLLASVWLILSMLYGFTPFFIYTLLVLCCILGYREAFYFLAKGAQRLRTVFFDFQQEKRTWKIVILLAAACVLIFLPKTLDPPSHDAMSLYMAVPKLIASTHRLCSWDGPIYELLGYQGEMHYAALLSIGGEYAAKMLTWPTALAAAALLWAMASRAGLRRRGQWMVMSMLFSSSGFTLFIGDGKVDMFTAALGLASLYWALEIRGSGSRLAIRIVGLAGGFASVAKLSYIATLGLPLFLIVIWRSLFCANPTNASRLRMLTVTLFSVALWASPPAILQMAKTTVLFQEPLAPFITFGDHSSQQVLSVDIFSPSEKWRTVLFYPFFLTFGRCDTQYGHLSPLALAFLPLAFLLPKPKKLSQSLLFMLSLASLAGVAFWAVFHIFPAPRHFLPPLLTLTLLPAKGAEKASLALIPKRFVNIVILIALFGVLLKTLGMESWHLKSTVHYVLAGSEHYSHPAWQAANAVNQAAQPGDRIALSFSFPYLFNGYLLKDIVSGNEWNRIVTESDDSKKLWDELYKTGAKYFIIDKLWSRNTFKFKTSVDPSQKPDWLQVEEIFRDSGGRYWVYRITKLNSSSTPSP